MNTVKITGKQQEVCGIITEVNQVILFLLILNLSENFKYKTSITGNNYNVGFGEKGYDATKIDKNETEVVIPLKYLSNFRRRLNIPLINCEVELILPWSKNCVLVDMTENPGSNPAIVAPTELTFEITDTKLYVPVVTLSKENDTKLLEQLKSGFKKNYKMEQIQITNDCSK